MGAVFDFGSGLSLSIDQPQKHRKTPPPFYFDLPFNNSSNYFFKTPGFFYFESQSYTPGTIFVIPWVVSADAVESPSYVAQFSATLDGVTASFVGEFDNNVTRFLTCKTSVALDDASYFADLGVAMLTDNGSKHYTAINAQLVNGIYTCTGHCMSVDAGAPSSITVCDKKESCLSLYDTLSATMQDMAPKYPDRIKFEYDDTDKIGQCNNAEHDQLTPLRIADIAALLADDSSAVHQFELPFWDVAVPVDNYSPSHNFDIATLPDYSDARTSRVGQTVPFVFAGGYTPGNIFIPAHNSFITQQYGYTILTPANYSWIGVMFLNHAIDGLQVAGYRLGINSSFQIAHKSIKKLCAMLEDTRLSPFGKTPWIDLPRPPVPPDPPGGGTITIPEQDYYIMQNVIIVTLDDDVTPIELSSINLSIDADSPHWTFSAQLLDPDEIAIVQQLPDGIAKQLHITINGAIWHVLVEKIRQSKTFANTTVNISGRGLTALLGKPYAQPASVTQGSTLTVQQLAEQLLPLDWTLTWDAQTWLVDGGAYSYTNKTPIEALSDLAQDIGAIIVPDPDSKTIAIKPRYSVLPWNFASVNVDVAIPDDVIIEMTEEPTASWQANGVYVHGNEIGGELGFCRLNGTAGDRLADTANNALMTDAAGLRSLGERLLAGQYSQPKIKSIGTFMDGVTVPFVNLGAFIGVTIDSVETRGIVNAVSINASINSVMQQLTIGETTPNTWAAFKEILPADPLLVGTLTSTDGTTSVITLIDGGVIRVRGTGTVNNKYYIRSGQIQGAAPNLTQYEIVI